MPWAMRPRRSSRRAILLAPAASFVGAKALVEAVRVKRRALPRRRSAGRRDSPPVRRAGSPSSPFTIVGGQACS